MADSFFGFDTSLSNLNDDEAAEPSEDEYDALNDETFGQDDDFDWEVEHEQFSERMESSRRHTSSFEDSQDSQLEASLSQLVLDETDAPPRALGSSVWRHDPATFGAAPAPTLKNVCTVEELERQLRQKPQQPPPHPQQNYTQNYYQPRFPVILQRPPGLQAPLQLPFAPQQSMTPNMPQMNQSLNKIIGQNNQMGPMGQPNQLISNQMTQNVNQLAQNMNQLSQKIGLGQNMNQMGQNINQMGPTMNQMTQNMNQIGQSVNQFIQNTNQQTQMGNQFQNNQIPQGNMMNPMPQNVHQMGQTNQIIQNQMAQNVNQMGQNFSQMGQNVNQLGQNMNKMGQNMNQMMPNGNQFGPPGRNQFPHMMGQPRMMGPPPGLNMPPRQNFNPNMGQYNPTFRPQGMATKPEHQMNQNVMTQQMVPQIKQKPVQNSPPKTQNRPEKLQKSRVYNNSKIMTSQNLVQLIQNTHPMLQYNSLHNASHHPMLNNNMINNQLNHPMFNHRQNGMYHNNGMMNGDSEEEDEYAGLMSAREKQWLINIQILQLNTGTPYIHDFYYTVFLERQSKKEKEGVKEAHKANQQNHPFYSGGNKQEVSRERRNSVRHNSCSEEPARTYVPTQFENSLGKLQCGSVTAPRKIIDVEVVGGEVAPARAERPLSRASTATNLTEVPRELKRTKQILLDIEALYLILLRLEELNDPLAISNALILKEREEKQRQLEAAQKEAENEQEDDSNLFLKNIESVQRRPKQESPKSETVDKRQVVNLAVSQKPPVKNLLDEDKDELMNKLFAGLLHGDRLAQILTVRKGKALLCRVLSRAGSHALCRGVWARALRALPAAARRDALALHHLAPHFAQYMQSTVGWSGVLESCSLLAEAFDPARTPYALTTPFTLSCVCSLVEKASGLVNTPEATSSERQWYKFLKTLARALKNTTLTVSKPLRPLPEAKLLHHMKQLESRSTIEILQRGKTTTEFADIPKNEVTEQLMKHLC